MTHSAASSGLLSDSDLVIGALEAEGVDVVFGIPGTHNLGLYAALGRSGIRHIAPRHEQGGGYAADGYTRSTGRPGVLITTSGPGVTNAGTALGTAYADSIPILVIAPGMRTDSVGQGFGQLHELRDQFAALSAIVGRSARVASGQEGAEFVHSVFAEWRSSRPRPAYLEIPYDLLSRLPWIEPAQRAAQERAVADSDEQAEQVAEAIALLRRAVTPVVVFGGGARTAAPEARRFVEAIDALVITTASGKGVIAETDPTTLGAVIDQPVAHHVMSDADALVVIGSELAESELGPNDWKPSGTLVRVDVDPDQLTARWSPQIAIRMDAAHFMRRTSAALTDVRPRAAAAPVRAVRPDLDRSISQGGAAWGEINELLSAALPPDTIVAGDSSQVSYKGTMYRWPMARPGQFLYPAGFATLGYGLPAAIGAKVGNPQRPVIVLQGDGGLMFSIQELVTAVELGLPIPIVVMNNGGYAEIREQMLERGIDPLGTDLHMPDFAALCVACGGYGTRADAAADIPQLVLEALQQDRPTLIEIAV